MEARFLSYQAHYGRFFEFGNVGDGAHKTRHLFSFASNLCWSIGREAVTGAKNCWKPEFNELALGGHLRSVEGGKVGMVGRLEGRVAFVTAAGGAIAGAIARLFASEGACVWCVDIREDTVVKTASDIEAAFPGHGVACVADVSHESSVQKAVEEAIARFGKLDLVVNAAAASEAVGDVVEMPFAEWQRVLNVNLSSVFLVCKYTAPHLRDAGGGSIINIGSTFGRVVVPRRPGYTTTKAAVIQLSKSMAIDFAPWNIRVNSISPGAIETARLLDRHPNMEAVRERFVPKHPIGRLGRPEEIAQAALYLATDASSFITASDLLVDGGYTAI